MRTNNRAARITALAAKAALLTAGGHPSFSAAVAARDPFASRSCTDRIWSRATSTERPQLPVPLCILKLPIGSVLPFFKTSL